MRRPSSRRGFSLAELLCAALALCVLAGAAALSFRDTGERRIVLEEAEELRAWLSSRMAQAAREGAEFKLLIDADKTTQELGFTIEWYGGPRDLETETYAPGRAADRARQPRERTYIRRRMVYAHSRRIVYNKVTQRARYRGSRHGIGRRVR